MSLDPAALLRGAVAIDSVSGGEAEAAAYVVEQVEPYVDRAYLDEAGNAVVETGTGSCHVLLLGHIDTVPGHIPVRQEEEILYGRGTVDAKGSLCAALAVAAELAEEVRSKLRVTVVGAVEEEVPSSRGARYLLESQPEPDYLIVGEPSGWEAVTLGYKGRLLATIEAAQEQRHSAVDAPTAAAEVVALWNAASRWVADENHGEDGLFEQLQIALEDIQSGSDGIRQWAQATLGFRLPPRWEPEMVRASLEILCEATPATLKTYGGERGYRGPRDTPLTRAFRVAIRLAGGRPRTKLKTGTSDMNVVAGRWHMPMVAYGPGDSSLDHTSNEHLSLDEYRQAIQVLGSVLERLAATTRKP